jgi:hypothetical protein
LSGLNAAPNAHSLRLELARPDRRARVRLFKNKMQDKHIHHYHGYAVQPSAHRLPDGSFSSNLLLERAGKVPAESCYQFYSLDYFHNEEQALQHSCRWARNWIDSRG